MGVSGWLIGRIYRKVVRTLGLTVAFSYTITKNVKQQCQYRVEQMVRRTERNGPIVWRATDRQVLRRPENYLHHAHRKRHGYDTSGTSCYLSVQLR